MKREEVDDINVGSKKEKEPTEGKPKRKRKYIPKLKICSCCGSFAHGKFHYNF